jgi:hypothetical protein
MEKIDFIDVAEHPLTVLLEKNYLKILEEFRSLANNYMGTKPNNKLGGQIDQKQSNGQMLYAGQIKSIFTRIVPESCSKPEYIAVWGTDEESKQRGDLKLHEKQQLSPVLESILKPFDPYIGSVGFNLMSPNTKLSMHYGMVSKYIRFHLGLICDPDAKFIVNNCTPRNWQEGKVWAFDDGSSYHGTVHTGIVDRLILLVDLDKSTFPLIKSEIYK